MGVQVRGAEGPEGERPVLTQEGLRCGATTTVQAVPTSQATCKTLGWAAVRPQVLLAFQPPALPTSSVRLVDEVVWVKMTVNRRLAKSHGFYLQHAKEVCLVARKGRDPPGIQRSVGADVILRYEGLN